MFRAAKCGPRAKAECEKAVALDPKYVEARFGLVQFYTAAPGIMGGSYEKAFEQAKEIKAIDPIAGHRAYAFIYTQQKKLELAKKEYADAIREAAELREGAHLLRTVSRERGEELHGRALRSSKRR